MRWAIAALLAMTLLAACDSDRRAPSPEPRAVATQVDSATAAFAAPPSTIAAIAVNSAPPAETAIVRDSVVTRPHAALSPSATQAIAVSASPPIASTLVPALDAGVVAKIDPEPEPVRSIEVSADAFKLWAQSRGRYKIGEIGRVEVVLVANGDYHVNPQYPYKLALVAPPAGLTYPSAIVRSDAMSISEKRGVMSVPVVPTASGAATVAGRFSLSVCTSASCHVETRDIAITITVD